VQINWAICVANVRDEHVCTPNTDTFLNDDLDI